MLERRPNLYRGLSDPDETGRIYAKTGSRAAGEVRGNEPGDEPGDAAELRRLSRQRKE